MSKITPTEWLPVGVMAAGACLILLYPTSILLFILGIAIIFVGYVWGKQVW